MASMTINSVNFGTAKGVKFEYVGLKVHQNVTCVKPHSVKCAPRTLTVNAAEAHGDGPVKKMGKSDEECEAAVVAGIVPEAPPVPPKPSAPAGTPLVTPLVGLLVL